MDINTLIAKLEEIKDREGNLKIGMLDMEFGDYWDVSSVLVTDGTEAVSKQVGCNKLGDNFVGIKP